MNRVIVLGGGIAGLSAAYYLAKRGMKPLVLEKENEIGGLGGYHKIGDTYIDYSYHIFFRKDEKLLELFEQLGLERDVVWGELDFKIIGEKGEISLSPLKILKSKALSLSGKISLAKTYFTMKNLNEWRPLDGVTAKEWLEKNAGKEVYREVFEPLIKAKWGDDSEEASAAWLYGRIKPRSGSRNIFGGKEKAGYVSGSLRKLLHALEEEIDIMGGEIIKSARVTGISTRNRRVESVSYVTDGKRKDMKTEFVVSALPVHELLKIAKLPDSLEERLKRIKYRAVICAAFGLNKKLTNSFRTIFAGNEIFGGLVEITNMVDKRHFGNNHVLYVFNFLDSSDSLWKLGDGEIVSRYTESLEQKYPGFGKLVKWSRLYRNRYGEPFYQKNYTDLIPDIETGVGGLFITGMVQSYPVSDFNNILQVTSKAADAISREIGC